jgi:hypothetical protein
MLPFRADRVALEGVDPPVVERDHRMVARRAPQSSARRWSGSACRMALRASPADTKAARPPTGSGYSSSRWSATSSRIRRGAQERERI